MKDMTIESAQIDNRKFGRWTVLDRWELTPSGEKKLLCRCDCGTERYVLERSLKYGGSQSCGCMRKEKPAQDLTGQVFGQLTVLRKIEKSGASRGNRWLCQCSCGETYEVLGTLLLTGRRTRCPGKAHEKNYAFTDIAGRRFGNLVALHPQKDQRGSKSVIWHCRCDCGNEIDAPYNSLMYSNLKSCGCLRKKHGENLKSFLTHVDGTSLDMIRSKKIPKDNTTGFRGVYLVKGRYLAKIVFRKKAYYLGTYDRIEEAAQARMEAEEILFDGVAEHYKKWDQRAASDPLWAKENPVRVVVEQRADKRLSVELFPRLETAAV